MVLGRISALVFVLLLSAGALAQEPAGQDRLIVPSPILVVDEAALFSRSAFGKQVEANLSALRNELISENRRIEAELAEEERILTERRLTMDPGEFRDAASAFDAKVVELRKVQDQRFEQLNSQREDALRRFDNIIRPVLGSIAIERGAVAVIKQDSVLISANAIDITDEAVRRIDEQLSDKDLPDQEEPEESSDDDQP